MKINLNDRVRVENGTIDEEWTMRNKGNQMILDELARRPSDGERDKLNINYTWPGGHRHAMHQSEHEAWNANNYPGTRQLCSMCEKPTGRCEDDTLLNEDNEPICEECYKEVSGDERHEEQKYGRC